MNVQKLNRFEKFIKITSNIISIPFLPFISFTIPQNHESLILRFGRVEKIYNIGIAFQPLFTKKITLFKGLQSKKITNLLILDKLGTPIVISYNMNYRIVDTQQFIYNCIQFEEEDNTYDYRLEPIFNIVENTTRNFCSKKIFISDSEEDISKNIEKISDDIKTEVNLKINKFGINIEDFKIIESNYDKEIKNQMLIKQQTIRYIESKHEIVKSSLSIIDEVIKNKTDISNETKEKILINLLTSLTSNTNVHSTINME